MLTALVAAHLLRVATGLCDALPLAHVADSLHVPRAVAWAVAENESGDGCRWNAYVGPGQLERLPRGDTTLVVRVCREVGRFQLRPCLDWRGLSPRCTTYRLSHSYFANIHCGLLRLRWLRQRYGSWPAAIQHYNGAGPLAARYAQKALARIGTYSLTLPPSLCHCSIFSTR